MDVSENFAFLKQEFPQRGGERKLRGAARLRRPTGVLLPCPARAGAPAQACLQGREGSEATKGHEPGRLHQRPRLPRTRARGRVAEGQIHPAGGQRGGPRQQAAGTGNSAGCRARALSRPLLDGPHLPAQGRGESAGQDLRRIPRLDVPGHHSSQRPGAGGPEGPAGCGRRRPARRSRANWTRCVNASRPSRRRTGMSLRLTTGTRTRPARSLSISIWNAPDGRWIGNRTVNTK